MQLVLVPKHVWQVLLQLAQILVPSASELRKSPIAQTVVHVPALGLKEPPGRHEVHPAAVASLQVAHDESHWVHVLLASANFPAGQLDTQEPSSAYLVPVAGQVRHDPLEAPLQVSQLE